MLSAQKRMGRQEFTQATTQDRNHLRYPSHWSPHIVTTPIKPGTGTPAVPTDPRGAAHKHAKGPSLPPGRKTQSRRENYRCVCLVFSAPPPPPGQLVA